MITTDQHEQELRSVMERSSVSGRVPMDRQLLRTVLEFMATVEHVLDPAPLPVHCRDPKDDYLLACAAAGRADFLVTGDRDLLALDGDPALGALRILAPADFLAALAARAAEQ